MLPLQVWMWAGRQPGGANISDRHLPRRFLFSVLITNWWAIKGHPAGLLQVGRLPENIESGSSLVPAGALVLGAGGSMSEGGSHWQPLASHQSATVRQGAITHQRASGHCLSAPRQVFLCSQTQTFLLF